jgi:polysaccharide export outer membrane protein
MAKLMTVLLLVCLGSNVNAQGDGLLRRPPPQSDYVLGAGDQLTLRVTDMEEISDKAIRIDPSGFVDLPLAGRIQAAGLTLGQFKSELATKLGKYITSPEIAVNLSDSGSQPVSVVGEVNLPGVHQLSGSKHLLEVISLSGGLKPDAGSEVIVTREPRWGGIDGVRSRLDPSSGYTTATLSLDSLISAKAPEENILMKPNDVVSIPKADLIYVVGDVKKAGGFQLTTHPTLSLLQAVSLAEGLGPDHAASHARILRPNPGGDGVPREIPIDVMKIFAGKAPDVQLYANDVLFIPHSGAKVTTRRALEAAIGVTSGLLIYR